MSTILLVGIGGALGSIARYIVSGIDYKFSGGVFPVSTLAVNLAGSLIIGVLWGLCEVTTVSSHARMFLFIGILGGFTTFSTFALENFNLLRDKEYAIAVANILLTNALGVAFVFIGYAAAKSLLHLFK
jgi:CrcB protein